MRVSDSRELTASFRRQAESCTEMGAPFTARICSLLAEHLDDKTQLGRRVLDWPMGQLAGDLLPLRCCAAFHAMTRDGSAPKLAQMYPPHGRVDDLALWRAMADVLFAQDQRLTAWLDSAPQTNEVARSGALLGGLLHVAKATGMPVDLFEIGAAAGLNLMSDHYHYDLGDGVSWGAPDAPLRVQCAWSGTLPPLDAPLEIASRAGNDLRPILARVPEDRERLIAYIWPDQPERIARATIALDVVAADGLRLESGDALRWISRRLPVRGPRGRVRVLWHSVFWQYLPADTRVALRDAIRELGAAAAADAPFAWLSMEGVPGQALPEVRLALWPGGERRLLGEANWHGKSVKWA